MGDRLDWAPGRDSDMMRWRLHLALLAVPLLAVAAHGQDIVSVDVPAQPVDPPAVVAAPPPPSVVPPGGCSACGNGWCDPHCNLYWLYVHNGVKNSFEFYGRVGPSFITSGGDLDDVLHTGIAADFGVKTFCYNKDRTGGWYGELGVDYIFNNANNLVPVIEKYINVDVIRNQGTFLQTTETVLSRDFLGITELHRVYAKIGGGYQWYWWTDSPDSVHWYLDLDGGIRLGHAHAALHLLDRQFLQEFVLRDNDVIQTPGELRSTDFIKNFYIGGGLGMLVPYCGYDITVELHWEYSHDIINLPTISNRDQGLDQVKVQVLAGARW